MCRARGSRSRLTNKLSAGRTTGSGGDPLPDAVKGRVLSTPALISELYMSQKFLTPPSGFFKQSTGTLEYKFKGQRRRQ